MSWETSLQSSNLQSVLLISNGGSFEKNTPTQLTVTTYQGGPNMGYTTLPQFFNLHRERFV